LGKFLQKRLSAAVSVGMENGNYIFSGVSFPRRFERRFDFFRMVGVIVN